MGCRPHLRVTCPQRQHVPVRPRRRPLRLGACGPAAWQSHSRAACRWRSLRRRNVCGRGRRSPGRQRCSCTGARPQASRRRAWHANEGARPA
eukprot:3054915-Prymnesium_polylepis.1